VLGELLEERLGRLPGWSCRRISTVQDGFKLSHSGWADVLLLDPGHPTEDVFGLADRLSRLRKAPAVIILADAAPAGWVQRAVLARVAGYVGHCGTVADIVRAVRASRKGDRFFTPCAAGDIADMAAGGERSRLLSRREMAVLREMCEGWTTKEIAQSMGLQPKTVDSIRARLMEKTGTQRSTALVRFACEQRFVDLRPIPRPKHARPARKADGRPLSTK
jgi:DNA-binding NarL/FixJ family response regulator